MINKYLFSYLYSSSPKEWLYAAKKKCGLLRSLDHFDEKHPCIFTLSTGRVGSQTLAELLKLSNNVEAFHEPRPKLFGLSKLAYLNANNSSIDNVLSEGFWLARQSLLRNALYKGKGYVETSPQCTFLAGVIKNLIPNARFIYLARHPVSVIRSGMRRNWYNNPEYDANRLVASASSKIKIQWDKASLFQKNVWLWAETNQWIINMENELNKDDILRIYSEKLFQADKDTLTQLYDYIGSCVPADKEIKKIIRLKLNIQRSGDFPELEKWTPKMRGEVEKTAGQVMHALKYVI